MFIWDWQRNRFRRSNRTTNRRFCIGQAHDGNLAADGYFSDKDVFFFICGNRQALEVEE